TLEGDDTFFTFTASGNAGDVDIDVTIDFGDDDALCDFPFDQVTIGVALPFCCAEVSSTLTIDCDGFDQIGFSTTAIAIPNLPFLTLDVLLEFTLQTKTLTLSPVIEFGATACFDLYIDLASTGGIGPGAPLTLDSITIDGVGISCDMGAVTFTGLSYWGLGTKPGLLAGTDYWEVYHVSSNEEACCGPFGFDLAVYFLDAGALLFDVSLIEASMTLQMASQFTFNMGMEIDLEIGAFTEWVVGFLVSW
ncbi:hypothetical protein IH601_09030, partial [Candidatus Bipolaricaulota bacterium]|nr:hypothetical protein [Candidatus Bipolaricaulota bacterium]